MPLSAQVAFDHFYDAGFYKGLVRWKKWVKRSEVTWRKAGLAWSVCQWEVGAARINVKVHAISVDPGRFNM